MSFWTELQRSTATRGATPLITWLSDLGRIELSTVTYANAVSKASNFLIDGLELDEESSIAVNLGNHWQSPVWLGTGLATGISITDTSAAITFGTLAAANTWTGSIEEFVVVSQDPFGMPDKVIPDGFVNGSVEVRNFGDYFAPAWPHDSAATSVVSAGTELTWDQLVERANQIASQHEIGLGQNYGLHGTSDLITMLALQVVLPVTNNSSVVLIDQANPGFDAIKKQEKLEQIVLLG
jgi:uncharacterized protein (TIGR03089 family)